MKRHERLLLCFGVAVVAPPLLVMWWFSAHAEEPPLVLYLLLPLALLIAGVTMAFAWRRSRIGVFIAPVAVLATCAGGTFVSNALGHRQVLAFCEGMLRAPRNAPSHVAELEVLASASQPECRIHDLTWGLWELGVYSGDEYVGYIGLLPDHHGSFVVAHVVLGGLR